MTAVAILGGKPTVAAEARIVSVGRRRGMGIFLVLVSLLMLFTFGLGVSAGAETTFRLTSPFSTAWYLAPLHFPVRETSVVMAAVSRRSASCSSSVAGPGAPSSSSAWVSSCSSGRSSPGRRATTCSTSPA